MFLVLPIGTIADLTYDTHLNVFLFTWQNLGNCPPLLTAGIYYFVELLIWEKLTAQVLHS